MTVSWPGSSSDYTPNLIINPVIMDDMGSLEMCTSLRSLSLQAVTPASRIILFLLSELHSSNLTTIALPFNSGNDPATLPDFIPLAGPLAGDNMKTLREVSFVCGREVSRSLVLAKLRRELPAVASILRLQSA